MTQMLGMEVNDRQNIRDSHLPHIEFTYNNSVSALTTLASKQISYQTLSSPPFAIFQRFKISDHQSFDCDELAYCDQNVDH